MLDLETLHPERPRPLRRVEYERLAEAGMFDEERVELLHGQIVAMTPQSAFHANMTAYIAMSLTRQLGPGLVVLTHSGLALWSHSMPEPDVAVVPAGPMGEHAARAFLVVEVAESSFRKDLAIKAPLYAEAGIPSYWIVERAREIVHAMERPADGRYAECRMVGRGGVVTCDALAGVAVSVDGIFAP